MNVLWPCVCAVMSYDVQTVMSYVSDLVTFKKKKLSGDWFSHLLTIVLIGAKFVFWEL